MGSGILSFLPFEIFILPWISTFNPSKSSTAFQESFHPNFFMHFFPFHNRFSHLNAHFCFARRAVKKAKSEKEETRYCCVCFPWFTVPPSSVAARFHNHSSFDVIYDSALIFSSTHDDFHLSIIFTPGRGRELRINNLVCASQFGKIPEGKALCVFWLMIFRVDDKQFSCKLLVFTKQYFFL